MSEINLEEIDQFARDLAKDRADRKAKYDATPELSFPIKAGTYWVGDPCYVYPDAECSDFCRKINLDANTGNGMVQTYNGVDFAVIGTAYGDRCCTLKDGGKAVGSMGVDAGLLSVIPVDLAETWDQWDENKGLGVIIEVEEDGTLNASGGNFDFCGFSVVTDDSDAEDEDEDGDGDEDDEEEDESEEEGDEHKETTDEHDEHE